MASRLTRAFQRSVYGNLNAFIKLFEALSKNPEIAKLYETAPDILKQGRTMHQMAMDDLMDNFAHIMRKVDEDKIPTSFFKQLMAARDPDKPAPADNEVWDILHPLLEEKRKIPDAEAPKPPEFLMVFAQSMPTLIALNMVNNYKNVINAMGRLTYTEEALESNNAAIKIIDHINNVYHSMVSQAERIDSFVARTNATGKKGSAKPISGTNDDADNDEDGEDDLLELVIAKSKKANLSKEARDLVKRELKRLKIMNPAQSEYSVILNRVEWIVSLPWKTETKVNTDINKTEEILNEDHYGLEKIKNAITEHVAVQNRIGTASGSILCLVGPPGVGKTSIAKSIARATGRKYVSMALGGIDDEAEIRGHRSTYIGAQPGRVIQAMRRVGTTNPLMGLDEIDKMSRSVRGDPTAALLEVLDPEQNKAFRDNYLGIDYDLSNVMFFCTANYFEQIPPPLRDRMEIIQLSGYTPKEKAEIGKRYLVPKQMKAKKLDEKSFSIADGIIEKIVSDYTQESGVRSLEKAIGKLCRKAVMEMAKTNVKKIHVDENRLVEYLGQSPVRHDKIHEKDMPGIVTGLAYTPVGGCTLTIEAVTVPGQGGRITATGNLRDVMRESITVAEKLVQSRAAEFGISPETLAKKSVHIHVPEGAIPKDGPSAGAAMTLAYISALTGVPIKHDIAMTGEINLRGEVTAIGGVPEKLQGALNAGAKTVLIPKENEQDLANVSDDVKSKLTIIPVRTIEDVLKHSLASPVKTATPAPIARSADDTPTPDELRRVFNWLGKNAGNDNATLEALIKKTGTSGSAPTPP